MPYLWRLVYIICGSHGRRSGIVPFENNLWLLELKGSPTDLSRRGRNLDSGRKADVLLGGSSEWPGNSSMHCALKNTQKDRKWWDVKESCYTSINDFSWTGVQKMPKSPRCHLGMQQNTKYNGCMVCRKPAWFPRPQGPTAIGVTLKKNNNLLPQVKLRENGRTLSQSVI